MSNEPSLGTCCACGGTDKVRNIYALPKKAPTPGKGWGCAVCKLPGDGALAVLCHEAGNEPKFAVDGYPAENKRVPIESLTGAHAHDLRFHSEWKGAA